MACGKAGRDVRVRVFELVRGGRAERECVYVCARARVCACVCVYRVDFHVVATVVGKVVLRHT